MNAICAEPASGVLVAQRCTSATRLPRVDSPPRFSVVPSARRARSKAPPSLPSSTGAEDVRLGDGRVDDRLDRRPSSSIAAGAVSGDDVGRDDRRWSSTVTASVTGSTVKTSWLRLVPYWPAETTGRPLIDVVVGQVRVAGDDRADVGVDAVDDPAERRCRWCRRRRRGCRGALVHQQHDDVGAVGLQPVGRGVGLVDDAGDLDVGDAGRADQRGELLGDATDEADLDAARPWSSRCRRRRCRWRPGCAR